VRVLLDEQLPRELAAELTGHEVRTVGQLGWKGLGNGELLTRAATRFDVLVTMDKAMPSEQDVSRYRVALLVL
jgi:predicted nuclease of predicted toxin-antitoxin system